MAAITNQLGAITVGGVEHLTYPPPHTLVKAMKSFWAEALLFNGSMRFGSLKSYRDWENAILGDPADGKAMYRMNGHPYNFGSANPVYAWCASLPTISAARVHLIAKHGEYDCVVRVHNPSLLIQRVFNALVNGTNKYLFPQCGQVSYDRGAEVDKKTLNSQMFQFNVFQKNIDFALDVEYRLSLTDSSLRSATEEFVMINIGCCSDIMAIEDLPNLNSQAGATSYIPN